MAKTRLQALAALLILMTSGAVAQERGVLPEIDFIRIDKSDRTLTLFAAGAAVRTYTGIQLGRQPVGPKHFEGDRRTPEGRYLIDYGNEASDYHRALHISYPGPADWAFAAAHGRSPGGLIMIHGQPNDWTAAHPGRRAPGDWTDGCIALADSEIDELWQAVPDGTPIEIDP